MRRFFTKRDPHGSASPSERMEPHQLSPVLLHCVLYGGWYNQEALGIARRHA